MADNIGYTPGSGATVAADDIGGVLYQRVKLTSGEDGTATDVSDANPLPVADKTSVNLLQRLLQYLDSPRGYDKSIQRQRGTVIVETLPTLGNVTTVTNVTNLLNVDGYNARIQILDTNRASWAQCVRARIT